MIRSSIAGVVAAMVAAAALAGCASAPDAPAQPTYLSDAEFQALMRAPPTGLPGSDYFGEERALTKLLARDDLTAEQRLTALMQRANKRGTIAEDRPGAIADYEQVLATAPAGHRYIAQATESKAYAETQMGHINRRLAAGPAADRDQYFSDLLAAGRHDEAAAYFREGGRGGIYAVEKLHKLGYLCEGAGYSGRSYSWGSENTRKPTVYWCDTKQG